MWETENKIFNRMWREGRRLRHSAINRMIEYGKAMLCVYDTISFPVFNTGVFVTLPLLSYTNFGILRVCRCDNNYNNNIY